MVALLLPTMPKGVVDDAADALAVAICHAHHRELNVRFKNAK
jgi:Holliday junction resolvasome RuvABC endonuclease subunit